MSKLTVLLFVDNLGPKGRRVPQDDEAHEESDCNGNPQESSAASCRGHQPVRRKYWPDDTKAYCRMVIRVEQGKGQLDRYVMFPQAAFIRRRFTQHGPEIRCEEFAEIWQVDEWPGPARVARTEWEHMHTVVKSTLLERLLEIPHEELVQIVGRDLVFLILVAVLTSLLIEIPHDRFVPRRVEHAVGRAHERLLRKTRCGPRDGDRRPQVRSKRVIPSPGADHHAAAGTKNLWHSRRSDKRLSDVFEDVHATIAVDACQATG